MSRRTLDRQPRTSPPGKPAGKPSGGRVGDLAATGSGPETGTGSPITLDDRDQRREPRRPAAGLVVVRFGQPQREVRGRLVDISRSGFRIAHNCKTLETGQTVEFSHPEAHGKARVVWNRIAVSGVETGLVLVGL
jgi:hypothetical protein